MILLIDNYDSFTYNLFQLLALRGREVRVVRHDHLSAREVFSWGPSHIVLSPGPKTPKESGICPEILEMALNCIPVLGVCLGHQVIADFFGGEVGPAGQILHGKSSRIFHEGGRVFQGISSPFEATRYHSLAVHEKGFPDCLKITARSEDGEIMALEHRSKPVFGLQFHPESVLTTVGPRLIENFLEI